MDILLKQEIKLYPAVISELTSLKKYSSDKLTFQELDEWRNNELPLTLSHRFKESNECWLDKDELIKLMDWKLMKGKFRPTLPKLIKSNDGSVVEETTKEGFAILLSGEHGKETYEAMLRRLLNKFCELRGVGPATSTLMASLLSDVESKSLTLVAPFFSDESFYWFNPDYGKLKYNFKEYFELYLAKYRDLNVDEADFNKLERATWAIFKQHDLDPSFKIDPIFLQNYKTYIQHSTK